MIPDLERVPAPVIQLSWTIGTLLVTWTLGHILNAVFLPVIARWARQNRGSWDDAVVEAIRPQIPRRSLLLG
jgi:hypothetical protein